MWNAFYESGADKELQTDTLYVSYNNQGDNVLCCIGEKFTLKTTIILILGIIVIVLFSV